MNAAKSGLVSLEQPGAPAQTPGQPIQLAKKPQAGGSANNGAYVRSL